MSQNIQFALAKKNQINYINYMIANVKELCTILLLTYVRIVIMYICI